MEKNNIFTAKTVDEAIEQGLKELGITLDEADITVIEEGKKGLFRSKKAQVMVKKHADDCERATEFVKELLNILKINVTGVDVTDNSQTEENNICIDIKCEHSSRVIGKRGDVLDAIQSLAGAVANIGREEYIKVVVDCENYRSQREETLVKLANKVGDKAIEKGRKIILEPMNPYERRIIHSALSERSELKTVSEGREPNRYVAVIPESAKPNDRGIRYGEKGERGEKRGDRGGRGGHGNSGNRRGDRGGRGERGERRGGNSRPRSGGGAPRAKKEIRFGTFLGNSGNTHSEEE